MCFGPGCRWPPENLKAMDPSPDCDNEGLGLHKLGTYVRFCDFVFALNFPLLLRGSVVPAKFTASGIYVIELPDFEIIIAGAETLPWCGSVVPAEGPRALRR